LNKKGSNNYQKSQRYTLASLLL